MLVADQRRLTVATNQLYFKKLEADGERFERHTWEEFLARTKKAHEAFLEANVRARTRKA